MASVPDELSAGRYELEPAQTRHWLSFLTRILVGSFGPPFENIRWSRPLSDISRITSHVTSTYSCGRCREGISTCLVASGYLKNSSRLPITSHCDCPTPNLSIHTHSQIHRNLEVVSSDWLPPLKSKTSRSLLVSPCGWGSFESISYTYFLSFAKRVCWIW